MIRKVKVKDLKTGMYVVKYGEGTYTNPFISIEKPILSEKSVTQYIPAHVAEVFIDDAINLDIRAAVRAAAEAPDEGPPPRVPLADEIVVVEKVYNEALSYAKTFMDDVRKGKNVDYRDSLPMVDGVIDSVFRNERAGATLCKLRRFDEYTYTHCINVSVLAVILGRHLRLSKKALRMLGVAGLFHDVGKAKIPEDILNKPGQLSDKEFKVMQGHSLEGYRIMVGQKGLHPEILKAILQHHERYDGRGYPQGLKGPDIGKFSRIVSVVDVYDALTSKRVYKDALAPTRALGMMYQWRLSDFYPNSVEHFIKCMGVYPVGSFVRLSDGSFGIICDDNPAYLLRPKIKVIMDRNMRVTPIRVVDLADQRGAAEPLRITECLNPADYHVDLSRYFFT
ncbi:MAG: HD-GYP domain-containing protein [Desulfovibrio aminophilus]|jgi:putative nucleotidyltransferase with HDIG domain|uniref:HD-GYP domain-containing protein n=1 Tax=Desulfovibrio aminophilus TaxID=81425 RepID=UPI0004289183|nr:HD-GYP domain-containing protein [Desulfovibrio aminophilus]MDY0306206.1 HD-GYP domain-containing protein [Desulfovibrionaceae bacterium]